MLHKRLFIVMRNEGKEKFHKNNPYLSSSSSTLNCRQRRAGQNKTDMDQQT